VSVRDAEADLAKSGVAVVGISPDLPDKQKKFDARHHLNFPLLSDPDHAVSETYGVWGEKNMYGKKVMGIVRSSFLIDDRGRIIQTWYRVSPMDTVPKAMAALAETK
jgi:peroxiredoxin Q/BCP